MGLMATMLPGVRPSISLASLPTASTSLVFLLSATIEGSLTTMPLPRAYTRVLAVPRSIAKSLEKRLKSERRLCPLDEPLRNPLDDILSWSLFLFNSCDPGTECSEVWDVNPAKVRLFWVFVPYCKDFFDPMLTIKSLQAVSNSLGRFARKP